MSAEYLLNQFRFNQMTLTMLLKDVDHSESLQGPEPGGNCINWMLGHLIATRGRLLRDLGREPAWREEVAEAYSPVIDGFAERALPLEDLKELLEQSLNNLVHALESYPRC